MILIVVVNGIGHAMVIERLWAYVKHARRHLICAAPGKFGDILGLRELNSTIDWAGTKLYEALGVHVDATPE